MKCPKCRNTEAVKNGIVRSRQRYRCRSCGCIKQKLLFGQPFVHMLLFALFSPWDVFENNKKKLIRKKHCGLHGPHTGRLGVKLLFSFVSRGLGISQVENRFRLLFRKVIFAPAPQCNRNNLSKETTCE